MFDRIRVVHLITDLDVGGAEQALARLLPRLAAAGIDGTAICLSDRGKLAASIEQAGTPVLALGIRHGVSSARALLRLVSLLRRLRPDILQTWLYHADLAGTLAAAAARIPRVAWNLRCAELDPRDHPRSLPLLLRSLAWLSGRPSAVVTNSVAGRIAHERLGYRPRRWAVIPNGFDTEVFRPDGRASAELRGELGLPPEGPLVGMLARFHPMKDHVTFLDAARRVADVRPDVYFLMAGRDVAANHELAGRVSALGLAARSRLLGERTDSSRFVAALDVAVSASYGEAFPNVIGEAMACGTLCVVTDVGDSAWIVDTAGVVVPPRDPERLAQGILDTLTLDPDARRARAEAGRARIATEFSLDRCAARYADLYRNIVGESPGQASTCAG